MKDNWTLIIRPQQKLWSVDFKEIWRYRDLIALFVKRNIVIQYKQTILGPLWYIIQPVLTVIMNMVVFGGRPEQPPAFWHPDRAVRGALSLLFLCRNKCQS